MAKVVVTGGTGLVGGALVPVLSSLGFEVIILSTNKAKAKLSADISYWNPVKGIVNEELIQSADYIIHLAGYSLLTKRWNDKVKQQIVDSRVESARFLHKVLAKKSKLKAFISASGVGYYGAVTHDKIYSEEDASYNDFVSDVCVKWEGAADLFQNVCERVVKLRIGIVLTKDGGAIPKMETPVKLGIGSGLGKGSQYMPWIHIDDLVNMFVKSIEDVHLIGVYNAVAPQHVTNDQLTYQLAKAVSRPYFFPKVPAFFLKLLFGEMGGLILEGSRVSAKKIQSTGYEFKYSNIESALKALYRK